MTPVPLFLSSAGVSLTIISSDRLGACPATLPACCLIACHLGHDWSRRGRGGGNWLDNSPTPANPAKWHPSVHTESHNIPHILLLGNHCTVRQQRKCWEGQKEIVYRSYVDALWTVHLAGCEAVTVSSGLADNMAKGIHLEQRGHTDKRTGQTKALDNKDSHAQGKVSLIVKGYRKQEKVTNTESEWFGFYCKLDNRCHKRTRMQEKRHAVANHVCVL